MKPLIIAGLSLVSCAACLGNPPAQPVSAPEGITPVQSEAYEACLRQNMAVATAWELIEERCAREARGDTSPLTGG